MRDAARSLLPAIAIGVILLAAAWRLRSAVLPPGPPAGASAAPAASAASAASAARPAGAAPATPGSAVAPGAAEP